MSLTDDNKSYPLTGLQQGIYLQCDLMQQPDSYLLQHECQCMSRFDEGAFHHAWKLIYENHTALQLAFELDPSGKPCQRIHSQTQLPIEITDISNTAPEQQQLLLQQCLDKDKAKGFDLSCPPLIRVTALLKNARQFIYIVTIHHIITDGWSMIGMLNEFTNLYHTLLDGHLMTVVG